MKNPKTKKFILGFLWLNVVAAVLATTLSCSKSTDPAGAPGPIIPQGAPRLSVMSINVENLFDTTHDEGKEDYTYLPLREKNSPEIRSYCAAQGSRRKECEETNWDEATLEKKLNNIADAILAVNSGRGPDVLLLEEVENINVLRMLNAKLTAAEYQTVELIEGSDVRGIDNGVLSRLPLASNSTNNSVPDTIDSSGTPRATRGILQVPLRLPDGTTLHVFVGHFPSQSNSRKSREAAFKSLQEAASRVSADDFVIAGGDLNVTPEETEVSSQNPVSIFHDLLSSGWQISTYLCKSCDGTEFFPPKESWSFFEVLLFAPKFSQSGSKWRLDPDSVRVQNSGAEQKIMNRKIGKFVPKRFFADKGDGVSDHWGIYAEFGKAF